MNIAARADIWGYVDETGKARISDKKLDDLYQLFFKGRSTLAAPDAGSVARVVSDEVFLIRAIADGYSEDLAGGFVRRA